MEEPTVHMEEGEAMALSVRILTGHGLSDAHAQAMARVIVAGQRDACASHGMYRLISCVRTIRAGKVDLQAEPVLSARPGSALVRVDARRAFASRALEVGCPALVEAARSTGVAALVVNQAFHFSALWPEVEAIAAQGLVALAMTPSHVCVAPAGGTRPVFGTNPIAFAWPRGAGKPPYVFDFATSAVAHGEIELHQREGRALPPGWGVDADGRPSTDPAAVMQGALLTFGGHKGSALSTMVELLAGVLIGDWTSAEASAFDDGAHVIPCRGELVLAFDPAQLGGGEGLAHMPRAEGLFDAITGQGARLPSQRRQAARRRSRSHGIAIPKALLDDIHALLRDCPGHAAVET
ncbi:Ldh family oxidoreductase [Xylophilus sp. GOD-11R]|nr:Ldh family oxidoreductase [Xylophilus sp. GOD-11R]WPB59457.1 Ldh family oxidoreductase [Xylophilus sp. GOD-11R]